METTDAATHTTCQVFVTVHKTCSTPLREVRPSFPGNLTVRYYVRKLREWLPSPPRRTRAEQKQQTRDALIAAALVAFSRDGYNRASLDSVAGQAGFSKGAVYSNFGSKAELFLAVMDYNLGALRGEDWDPFESAVRATGAQIDESISMDPAELVRGFGLATLEFITTAARDPSLTSALGERMRALLDAYGRLADRRRSEGETLTSRQIGYLMAALDQGATLLFLSGVSDVDGPLLRDGLRRLLLDTSGLAPDGAHSTPLADVDRIMNLLDEPPHD